MANERDILEKALAPGNLVHGGKLNLLPSFSDRGIMTPFGLGVDTNEVQERRICFALLGNQPLPQRYSKARHHGPNNTNRFNIAIVVSGLHLRSLPCGELYALGDNFWNPQHASERRYYSFGDLEVYGITIRPQNDFPDYERRYEDEVRLKPTDPKNMTIREDIWTGIVINKERLETSRWALVKASQHITHPIPLISENCELLADDIREI